MEAGSGDTPPPNYLSGIPNQAVQTPPLTSLRGSRGSGGVNPWEASCDYQEPKVSLPLSLAIHTLFYLPSHFLSP